MVKRNCEFYAGDDETIYCLKKGYFHDCRGCNGFKKQVRLRALIIQKCGNVRRFSAKVGLTESMLSKMLNGNRVIMPWHYENFANVLGITEDELREVIE